MLTAQPNYVVKITIPHKNGNFAALQMSIGTQGSRGRREELSGLYIVITLLFKTKHTKHTKMYTIISGTNRPGSNTLKVAKEYQRILTEKNVDTRLLSLEGINLMERDDAFKTIESEILAPAEKFIFIVPEYNGSFPGALKMLFDGVKPYNMWWHKKALLTGVSTGRAGNTRGMDHLASILNFLKITVHPNQLPISVVDKLMDADGKFTDETTLKLISQQLDAFIVWSK